MLRFQRPSSYYLPLKNFSFRPLFRSTSQFVWACLDDIPQQLILYRVVGCLGLSIENVLKLFCHMLAERKIIMYANDVSLLTPCAEALRTLLFPLTWQFAFVPVLPSKLSYVLKAPVPLIVGMHRSFLDEARVDHDVVMVDLDRNDIHIPHNQYRAQVHMRLTSI